MLNKLQNKFAELCNMFLNQNKREYFERKRMQDTIIIWLVGISSGLIALIISQFDKLVMLKIGIMPIKISVASLTLTIILGVLYRALYYYYEELESASYSSLYMFLSAYSLPVYEKRSLIDCEPKQIADFIKQDFQVSYDDFLHYGAPVNVWQEYYDKCAELHMQFEKESITNLLKAIAINLGYQEDIFLKPVNNVKRRQFINKLGKNIYYIYLSTFLSFILAILVIVLYFLCYI